MSHSSDCNWVNGKSTDASCNCGHNARMDQMQPMRDRLAHLESLVKEIADMKIHVKTDPAEGRSYYLDLAFKMRDLARKGTGKDYTVKIEKTGGGK